MDLTDKIGKPFGNSLWREAAKIDKLLKDWERTKPENKTPELEEALYALQQLVAEYPQIDGILPWIWQRLKKGELTVDAEGNVTPTESTEPAEGEEPVPPQPISVVHMADWFADKNSPTRKGVDIMQLSPSEVQEKVNEWDQELATKRDQESEQEQLQGQGILYKWPDGSYLRQIQTNEECIELGVNTGNCLRDQYGGYFDRSAILEYVNAEGKQEVALEIQPKPGAEKLPNGLNDPRGGTLKQVQAKRGQDEEGGGYFGNKLPTEEVQRKLREFFQTIDVADRPMISGGRSKMISEPKTVEEFKAWIQAGNEPEFTIADLGEDFVISDQDWEAGNLPQSGYIGGGHEGPSIEQSSAMFGLPIKNQEVTRGETTPTWNSFVRGLAEETAASPEQAIATLKEVYKGLSDEGQLERFQEALHEELPELERVFYTTLYDKGLEEDLQTQFKQWPLIQGFGNELNPFGPVNLSRGLNKEPIDPPFYPSLSPDQMELPDMPPMPDRHPMFASKKLAVYYRWSFSPNVGVKLSNNEGPDAFINYNQGSGPNLIDGYAYRTKSGWRLTDREHRPIQDPYVASEVARQLKKAENPAN